MLEADRKARNQAMLLEMHPAFRARMEPVLRELESFGYRPRVQQAWRSPAEQLDAYRRGYSKVQYGYHNATSPGGEKESLAADVWDDDRLERTKTDFMLHLLAAAEKNGLTTGIRWSLSDNRIKLIDDALASGNWKAPVYVGWDPLHVEITGLTLDEVKQGKRPAMPGEEPPPSGGETAPEEPPSPEPEVAAKRHFKVEDVEAGKVKEYALGNPLRPVALLPVPYVSQLGPDANAHNNDCGAACAVMLLQAYQKTTLTPDAFYTTFGIAGDPYLSVTQIANAMGSMGLLTEFHANLSIQDLFGLVASGKPPMVLIRYKPLVDAGLTESEFLGPHFAVVVGVDTKYIYINDPLYTDPFVGEAHPYPLDVFWQAWKEVATQPFPNPERSALIPAVGLGFQMVKRVKVNIATLNVRSGPGLTHPVVDAVHRGDILSVSREMSGWGEIGFNRWVVIAYTLTVN